MKGHGNGMTLELINVSKSIRGVEVLHNISMQMESGTVVGLRGINGSGKTMTLRLIAGLIKPTKGSITIEGKVLGKDISFPESIGVFLENPAFLDYYSGFENLKLLASIKNVITENQIKEIIQLVGLNPNDKKHYKKYSLGMKQRLGIAAAIMESPDIVLLDEPTNSLDESGVQMVCDVVHSLREAGKLVVLTCHDIQILEALSDHIYYLKDGNLSL